jgi:hypothetical protein
MTYHVVFDIAERFPDALMAVPALLGAIAVLALSIPPTWRRALRKTSAFWVSAAGLVWGVPTAHNIGGPYGLLFGGVPAILALGLAFLAWTDREVRFDESFHPRARTVAPAAAAVLFLGVSLCASYQWRAFDLAHQLAVGDTTVVTGAVQDAYGGGTWGSECFTVDSHRYCYSDGPNDVGFHQTAANGGPIRNGLQVRVSSVGDVIVRLEVADGP